MSDFDKRFKQELKDEFGQIQCPDLKQKILLKHSQGIKSTPVSPKKYKPYFVGLLASCCLVVIAVMVSSLTPNTIASTSSSNQSNSTNNLVYNNTQDIIAFEALSGASLMSDSTSQSVINNLRMMKSLQSELKNKGKKPNLPYHKFVLIMEKVFSNSETTITNVTDTTYNSITYENAVRFETSTVFENNIDYVLYYNELVAHHSSQMEGVMVINGQTFIVQGTTFEETEQEENETETEKEIKLLIKKDAQNYVEVIREIETETENNLVSTEEVYSYENTENGFTSSITIEIKKEDNRIKSTLSYDDDYLDDEITFNFKQCIFNDDENSPSEAIFIIPNDGSSEGIFVFFDESAAGDEQYHYFRGDCSDFRQNYDSWQDWNKWIEEKNYSDSWCLDPAFYAPYCPPPPHRP